MAFGSNGAGGSGRTSRNAGDGLEASHGVAAAKGEVTESANS